MFEFLKKILHKPNPALPESIQGLPVRETHELDEIWVDILMRGQSYVVVRQPGADTPPWYAHDEAYL